MRSSSCIIYPDDDQSSTGSIKINMPTDLEDHSHPDKSLSTEDHGNSDIKITATKDNGRISSGRVFNHSTDRRNRRNISHHGDRNEYHSPRDIDNNSNDNDDNDDNDDNLDEVYELTSAMQEYENIGVRSKQYGYQGSRDALCYVKNMNDNYVMAMHYMNRYIIQDYQITVPSVTMAVFYPNKEISSSLSTDFMRVPTTALMNVLYLSLPNPITVTMNTIITHTSRDRMVVNIPTIVGRVLKGIDYQSSIPLSRSISIHIPDRELPRPSMGTSIPGNRFGETSSSGVDDVRYLCIGELVCTARIAMYVI